MSGNDVIVILLLIALFSVIFYTMGYYVGSASEEDSFRKDAIKRNVARYHPQTGKWEWTVEETK